MDSLTPQLQQFYLILKCLFPDLGCPLSGRGSSKPFLPPVPAAWPLPAPQAHTDLQNLLCGLSTHCKFKSILPAQAGHRDAKRLIHTLPAAVPGAPGILLPQSPSPCPSHSLRHHTHPFLENHFNELTPAAKREMWKLDQRSYALETAGSPSWL